jgi:hypothetical protein
MSRISMPRSQEIRMNHDDRTLAALDPFCSEMGFEN